MKKVKLGEVCDVFSGYAFKSFNEVRKGKPVIKIGNVLSNGKIEIEDCSYTEEIPQNKYLSQKNDIYVALSGATTGKVGLMQKEGFLINQRVGVVRLKNNEVPINYIYSFLQSKTSKILEDAFGAAQPNISPKDILNYEIFIGENAEMQKIADRLDKVSSLIEKRKTQLTKLDQLIKSRFIEMFGDPISNPMGWKTKRFDSLCENLDSRRKPITASEREAGIYPYYGASGIVDYVADYLFDEDILLVSEDGANLLMRSTPIAFSVSGKVWVNNHAHVVRFEKMSMQKYIEVFFSMIDISEYITGSAQPKLNQAKLNAMMFPVPDNDRLEAFLSFVEQTDKSKLAIQKSIDKLETLKKSLMQQYFG